MGRDVDCRMDGNERDRIGEVIGRREGGEGGMGKGWRMEVMGRNGEVI